LVLYGDPKPALAAAERALALRTDDPRTFAEAHLHAGLSLLRAGSVTEGAMRMRKALAAASRGPYNRLIALIVQSLATAYAAAGNFAAAREASWEALRLFRAAGSHRLAALNAPNLAEFEFAEGHTATALELTLESVAYFREHRVWSELGWALGNVSAYLIAEDRFDEARTHARESLVLACESRHGAWLALALQHLAAVAALDPNRARELQSLFRAANLLGYVNESAAHAGFRRETTEQREYERIVPILREKLGTRFDQLLNAGSSWPEDRAVAEALGMP
jgi:tetratricopeptide (TPR) repeat protein